MSNISIRTFIEKFNNGDFDLPFTKVQIEAGWYDWFCKDSSLRRKTEVLGKKIVQLSKSPKIDLDKHYVFFKNNCPMNGPLYDSFSICNLEDGDVQFWITPKSGHSGKAEVYARDSKDLELVVEGGWRDVKNYFLKEVGA